jgi:hypothetical protein
MVSQLDQSVLRLTNLDILSLKLMNHVLDGDMTLVVQETGRLSLC